MEPRHEFGKEAREKELAEITRRRKITKIALMIVAVMFVGILIYSFRSEIGHALTSSEKGNTLVQGKKKDQSISGDDMTILKRWDLPEKLTEISGLTWMDEQRFACVQDETGTVFIYNTVT